MRRRTPVILVHGGAGARAMTAAQRACLHEVLAAGLRLLQAGAPAVQAVETAVRQLEGSGLFNAGVGARLQLDGARRMDASIMDGARLQAGAVAAIEGIRHPISAARLVMERTGHVLLVGPQASRFARAFKVERLPPPTAAQRRTPRMTRGARPGETRTLRLYRWLKGQPLPGRWKDRRTEVRETVGAVALDAAGHLAAGASTGGVAIMLPGRVGDTPLIGSGVYADDQGGAVSLTGVGEGIIRVGMAKEIVDRLAAGAGPQAAVQAVLKKLTSRIQGSAGALVLAPDGRYAVRHNTLRMVAGAWDGRGKPKVGDRFR
ncbi:MAG: isoaspartyl peptidase/L-asparaginase family protein [Nitrospirales bacterium]